ncbi:phenylpyruvate tautomerase MIF-related protein [uncultured Eubacterium sp.]|uniref:phenylpyruvate tautomerase MIF-related protein n=1 Tax=uncultured Eubacterium sp. TaxID=165185 RepID=UPI0015B8E4D9|nr:phenylpyruvate tautomerase MIF-related protein [uncultured Eubacterium sp.]
MPFINTNTNVEISDEKREELKSKLGQAIRNLGKSEDWLMLSFEDKCDMYFKGDGSSPMAFVDVSVFGYSDDSACEKMTVELCSIYNDVLGISPDKLYVKYSGSTQWGWNNMNF